MLELGCLLEHLRFGSFTLGNVMRVIAASNDLKTEGGSGTFSV
jgi:hypothetical protein